MKIENNKFVNKFVSGLPPKNRCQIASELRKRTSTKLDKMERRILKMLSGLSILDIEWLLVNKILSEAKRRSKI